jgi:hypothetical protein
MLLPSRWTARQEHRPAIFRVAAKYYYDPRNICRQFASHF